MDKFIAILRGINVGGKNKLLMTDLKVLFKEMGFSDIATYIQSGNVIFSSRSLKNNAEIETKIAKGIEEQFKLNIPVIVRSKEEFKTIINENPYAQTSDFEIQKMHITFFKTPTSTIEIDNKPYLPDLMTPKPWHTYLYLENKYHQTKLSNQLFEKKLKTIATTRNYKTALKILSLLEDEK